MKRTLRSLTLFLSCVLVASAALAAPAGADELEARVDRVHLAPGETLQLLLRYRGERPSTPDLSALRRDFEVLEVRQGTRTSIVNGVEDRSVDFVLTLAPKGTGTIELPALTVGGATSEPVELEVSASAGSGGASTGAPVEVEVTVDDEHPFVQGKVTVTARVFMDERVRGGALTDPDLDGALLERLGEDRSYRAERGGRMYDVVERSYALFPQESGVVQIPPLVFEGTVRAERGRRGSSSGDPFGSPFDSLGGPLGMMGGDPFGSSFFDDFFDRGRPIRAASEAIELVVQPKPESAEGGWWLPARQLVLTEDWSPEPPEFRVGEQVLRTLTVQAAGLSSSQLPELACPPVEGLKQYPDPSVDRTVARDGETYAVRQERVALIPTRAGEMTLPAIEVEWWDTEAGEHRTAVLPARTVQVRPGSGQLPTTPLGATAAPEAEAPAPAPAPAPDDAATADSRLSSGAAFGLGAGVVLLIGGAGVVLRRRRRGASATPAPSAAPSLRRLEADLRRACRADSAAEASRALAEVGRARWPEGRVRNAGDVGALLGDASLADEIERMSAARFGAAAEPWSGESLWLAYRGALRKARPRAAVHATLPALYPQA